MSKHKKTSITRKKQINKKISKRLIHSYQKENKDTSLLLNNNTQSTKIYNKRINGKKSIIYITMIFIILIVIAYYYFNISNKANYTFITNFDNMSIIFSNSENKLKPFTRNTNNTIFSINKNYDQVKIYNNEIEENFNTENTFFKYYGEKDIILFVGEKYPLNYIYFTPKKNSTIRFKSNNESVSISNNIITAEGNGEATIYAYYGTIKKEVLKIISTNLIVKRPHEFDETKEFIECEHYSNEENILLDKILEKKIELAGYETRAGAVEALRFLSLDFPNRIDYFNENGRLPNVDAQGRYYHKGLYLSSEKYQDLINPNDSNKGAWGCKIFSAPANAKQNNGLDCSGLIGWALYNAGYNPEDYKGANLQIKLGKVYEPKKIIDSGKIKVGDLVHNEEGEGHIGMIIGIDGDNYYVCQSIWYKPKGVIITKYSKTQFVNHWLKVSLMDDYYKEDGNLTDMWY